MTVFSSGKVAAPYRVMKAIRDCVWAASSPARRPIHSWPTCTSANVTVPVGSVYCVSAPSGSKVRMIWFDVHVTVATVGMPSRWYTSARPGS